MYSTSHTVLYQYKQTMIGDMDLECSPRELAARLSARHESWPLGVRGPGTQPDIVSTLQMSQDNQDLYSHSY